MRISYNLVSPARTRFTTSSSEVLSHSARFNAGAPILVPRAPVVYERQELVPSLLAVAERPQHRARHRAGMLLLHTAHHHAEMSGLADHAHAQRIEDLLNRLRQVLRQPLLNLQAPREHVHQTRNLA